jgi:TRAP-type C4-dicarboxylate transport system permease small subunit
VSRADSAVTAVPTAPGSLLPRLAHGVSIAATFAAAAALLVELAVVLVGVIGRTLIGHGPLWSDEASRLALAIIAFIGGAAAYRGAHHTAIRLITDRLGEITRQAVGAGIEWLVLIVTVATAWHSIALLTASWAMSRPSCRSAPAGSLCR